MSIVVRVVDDDGERDEAVLLAHTGTEVVRRIAPGKWLEFANDRIDPEQPLTCQGVVDGARLETVGVCPPRRRPPPPPPAADSPAANGAAANDANGAAAQWSNRCRGLAMVLFFAAVTALSALGIQAAECQVPLCDRAANATLDCCITSVYNTTCHDESWVLEIDSCADQWSRVDDACQWWCRYHDGATVASATPQERSLYDGLDGQKGASIAGLVIGSFCLFVILVLVVRNNYENP